MDLLEIEFEERKSKIQSLHNERDRLILNNDNAFGFKRNNNNKKCKSKPLNILNEILGE